MKKVLWSLLLLAICSNAMSQTTKINKDYIGRYGSSDGICIFEDGKFLLYGYATMVFGNYKLDGSKIEFRPYRRDLFEFYGNRNPQLENGKTRWHFVGFERGNTFVKFDEDSVQRVFNVGANCFSSPFIHNHDETVKAITLIEEKEGFDGNSYLNWQFTNADCNDFIIVYNEVKYENEDFFGTIEDGVLRISNYGGDSGYKKHQDDHEWDDIISMKKEYENYQGNDQAVYANREFANFQMDSSRYTLELSTNQYMVADTTINAAYYKDSPYQDDRILRKFDKMERKSASNKVLESNGIAHSTIFYTTCEDVENSYRYKSEYESEEYNLEDHGHLPILEPIPVPLVDEEEDKFWELVPFTVERENGLYLFQAGDKNSGAAIIIADTASLLLDDISSVEYEIGDYGFPVVRLKLGERSAEKFAKLTKEYSGQYLAIIVDNMAISIPQINQHIADGHIQIRGNFSVEEAQNIVKALTPKK